MKTNYNMDNIKLNEFCQNVHQWAKNKGFWDYPKGTDEHLIFCQKMALVHSEISEAIEADRKNLHADIKSNEYLSNIASLSADDIFNTFIKDTVEDELADTLIRIFDYCGYAGIDIETHIKKKMKYNNRRKHKHEKEY